MVGPHFKTGIIDGNYNDFYDILFFVNVNFDGKPLVFWSRVIGSYNLEPTTGYSTHVRVATMGTVFYIGICPCIRLFSRYWY